MTFEGPIVVLATDNIDTDQIIPARFLKTLTQDGLGDQLFFDWRYDEVGRAKPEFALNRPEAKNAHILVAGSNFGCGSSREHAVWALMQFGFRVVVSRSFGDIFARNALKNGLLPIVVPSDVHTALLAAPGAVVRVDLVSQSLTTPDRTVVTFPIDEFSKLCLLDGVDELEYILKQEPAIAAYEARRTVKVGRPVTAGSVPVTVGRVEEIGP
jgi:3-isopropylmalate/(R)-2-methylmalate dehydratase small subunit